jgi:NADPH:quinone reductase-like Zn-dependent oxidoreductase
MKLKRALKWTAGGVSLALVVAALVAYWTSGNACDEPAPAAPRNPIKAVVYCEYGPPDVLRVEDVEKPVPDPDQMLVRVRAAAINPLEWHYMRGEPYFGRLGMGLRKPASTRLGVDYAGTVEAVGANVTQFKPGDEVFGGRNGALAEYIVVRADRAVVTKPPNVTFEQAAGVPVAGLTALQALRDQGGIEPGQRVLINGASGGVGTFAVQIAKAMGAHVTGVSSTRNVELVRSIGADAVIDYTKDNFTERPERYDLIIDNVGNHSLFAFRRILEPDGKYIMVGGPSGRWIDPLPRVVRAMVISSVVSQDMHMFISELRQPDLIVLRDLMAAGKVTPVIDRRYPLSEIREAMAYLETGRARGKVIITMD